MLESAEFKHLREQERRNKKLIEQCWDEIWNQRNAEVFDEYLSEDIVYYSPRSTVQGIEAYKKMYETYAKAFGNTELKVQELIASGNKVVSRVEFNGLHNGELEGIPASGKAVKLQAFTIYTLEHGKIVEERELFDELGMMLQIGMELRMKETVE